MHMHIWSVNKHQLFLCWLFFHSEKCGIRDLSFLPEDSSGLERLQTTQQKKFCGPKQWTINNIVALIWIILCSCKFDRSNWTKEEEKNSFKHQNPKKIKAILNERNANGIYCNHREGKKKVQIMKRPELELNDVSEELYRTFFAWFSIFVNILVKEKKKISKPVTPRSNKKLKKEKK